MVDIAVELRNVTKRFGDVVAVDDVSLEIRDNEFFSLLGPSGCGKTTTLRIIGGFEHPTVGQTYIAGRRVNSMPPHKRDTNMIFQNLALFPHMDVYDNIAFGLRMTKLPKAVIREKVASALELVDLVGLASRRISQLSGGQLQRVAIARALVNEPAVLLLDEPLGALDLKLRLQMELELKELQHRVGTTFIYVTHDQTEALTMSDRLAVMRDGRIEQIGSCKAVYERPRSRFVASFIGDSNILEGVVSRLEAREGLVDCRGMPVLVRHNDVLRKGQPVTISVRPERIKVGLGASDCENVFSARVRAATYKGSLIDYELQLPSGDTVVAQVQVGEVGAVDIGREVRVGWTKRSAIPVKDS
ncbi:MAG: ABC transporter ATP-binding protein [bacterium]